MTAPDNRIRFQPGTIVATVGALQVADNHAILELLRRHLAGDWGDERNAENVIVLRDMPDVAARYEQEWRRLWHESEGM